MKFLHLADLHFGKVIHGASMLEKGDQPYWVDRLLELVESVGPDAVLIAGDVYDRALPPGEAVRLLSRMLTELANRHIPVMITAGNHDSVQRLSFAGDILAEQQLYISAPLTDAPVLTHVTLEDEHGPVTFWLMPYVFPALVEEALGEEGLRDYDTAVRRLLETQPMDPSRRNVLIAHQNVTAGGVEVERGGSETMVGGVGQIDYTAFDAFDYVALGHIHSSYHVGRKAVRYAGSPLCYHFDEIRQPEKGPLLITLGEKGSQPEIRVLPIPPLHPMREVKAPYEELRAGELARSSTGEYLRYVITDRRVTPEIADFLRELAEKRHSVLMELTTDYERHWADAALTDSKALEEKPVEELFTAFYTERNNGQTPDEQDLAFLTYAAEQIRSTDTHGKVDPAQVERLLQHLLKQEGNA